MPKRTKRHAASVAKNAAAFTPRAPAASTIGVNGNGGGMRLKAARRSARVFCSMRFLAEARYLDDVKRSSPASPTLLPIQNVASAPATEPAVASNATAHHGATPRIDRTTVAASIPNGNQKNRVESRAARIRMPIGLANVVRTQ